jgi:hypothetical protein
MIGRRAVIGLSLLCALAFSAISATGAMAETKTTTAFECVPAEGGAGFSKEHCAAADAVSTGAKFKHKEIAVGAFKSVEGTNAKTASETTASTQAVLKATIGGLKAIFTAGTVTATGEMENFENPVSKAMDIKGRDIVITFTKVVLAGALSTVEGCEVLNGQIITEKLVATSQVNTMEGEFSAEAPGSTLLAKIFLKNCKTPELNTKPQEVTGTAHAIGDGATLETTEASTAGLKVAGQPATLTSRVTMRLLGGNPVSPTTIIDQ